MSAITKMLAPLEEVEPVPVEQTHEQYAPKSMRPVADLHFEEPPVAPTGADVCDPVAQRGVIAGERTEKAATNRARETAAMQIASFRHEAASIQKQRDVLADLHALEIDRVRERQAQEIARYNAMIADCEVAGRAAEAQLAALDAAI